MSGDIRMGTGGSRLPGQLVAVHETPFCPDIRAFTGETVTHSSPNPFGTIGACQEWQGRSRVIPHDAGHPEPDVVGCATVATSPNAGD